MQALNTADHFTLMMDHEIRRSGLAGNFCALVFELGGVPDAGLLARRAAAFAHRFPETHVRLRQKGRRYFWAAQTGQADIFFHHRAADAEQAHRCIAGIINAAAPATEAVPIEFHLVEMPGASLFLLRWFHPICDAKGAELIVHHLLNDTDAPAGEDLFTQFAATWNWWKKLGMMVKAKRNIDALDRLASSLPPAGDAAAGHLDFHLVRFDTETSKRIMQLAMKSAGMTGTALYFIGCMMRAMARTGCDARDGFCVPYAMNMRRPKAQSPVFGNQVSFLFAQADMLQIDDRSTLFTALRDQHKATVRTGMDQALIPLMQAGSWLPLEKYGRIIRNSPKGRERSSFWFSYTGEPDPKPTEICGIAITGMYQLSQVTAPPSLGMLVNQYGGEITLSFNYIVDRIERPWLERLAENISAELQGESAV